MSYMTQLIGFELQCTTYNVVLSEKKVQYRITLCEFYFQMDKIHTTIGQKKVMDKKYSN
jgi:hypothetical protein